MSLLAIDVGSSACKAVIFALDGQILAQHSAAYAFEHPHPSFAEINPEKFWNVLRLCCRSVTKDVRDRVQAICLSSHGETFVAIDAHGTPLGPAILNQDSRAISEAAQFEKAIGRERLFQITGLLAHPMYPIAKILWLRKHKPEMFAQTACFVSLVGYLLQKMQLPSYVDCSLASRYLAFDIRKRAWSDEILAATDLKKDQLPVSVAAGTIAGKLSSEIANELGLPAGTPVVLGGHDQPCGALGVGAVSAGRVADSMGTYECLTAASDSPTLSDKALRASLNSYCHVVPDKFVTLAYFPSGIMIKWFHDLLYSNQDETQSAPAQGDEPDHYSRLEAHVPDGPTGLCITPHLIGTGNPEFNPRVRGAISGLEPGSDRHYLFKGILEGIACELAIVAEALAHAVGNFNDIYATGGGTRSALGLQLRGALTGRSIHIMRRQESVCLGTAILAGVAIGEYASIGQAVTTLVQESTVLTPSKTLADTYRDQMNRYRQLRASMVQQA